MLITVKFGGTSVGSAARIAKAAEIVANMAKAGHQVVVVTSAMSGVTNSLVEILDQFKTEPSSEADQVSKYFQFTKQLEQKHHDTVRQIISDAALLDETLKSFYGERHDLERVLMGSHFLGELTPIGYDFVVSTGERMCVPVLAAALKNLGVDAQPIGGYGAGIMTDNNYGNARPLAAETRASVRETLLPMLQQGQVPICPGFYGKSRQGRVATLGRGGSDYSATLIGCALDADEIVIMTDVDGIKTCDPRVVPAAQTIEKMPYSIAAELAMLGAKVLHQKSVAPASAQKIPLRIASSFEPEKPGTLLVPPESVAPRVWALTLVRGGLVRVHADETASAENLNSRIFSQIEQHNVELLASAGSRAGRTLLALASGASFTKLIEIARDAAEPGVHVSIEEPVALLGVVGDKAATQSETFGKVAECLSGAGVETLGILQGASPQSLLVVLNDDPAALAAAMQSIHTKLGLDP